MSFPLAVFCGHCGVRKEDADHTECERRLAMEPPRFCDRCARRMKVQVIPRGWTARCSEHGSVGSDG